MEVVIQTIRFFQLSETVGVTDLEKQDYEVAGENSSASEAAGRWLKTLRRSPSNRPSRIQMQSNLVQANLSEVRTLLRHPVSLFLHRRQPRRPRQESLSTKTSC